MAYEYVTDNNLYEKQNYMYSEYRGMEFIKDYLDSRRQYADNTGTIEKEAVSNEEAADDPVQRDLMLILWKLKAQKCDRAVVDRMNAYTKSFEVRKRIYSGYDECWKPIEGAGFENYLSYLLLADCLLYMYESTGCLKYFSCLLKVDDTLLSVSRHLSERLMGYFREIISRELNAFYQLADQSGIDWEVAG